jgi:hypothetical protein
MEDSSKDIFQRYGANQEELYERVEKELKEIQQVIDLHNTYYAFFFTG